VNVHAKSRLTLEPLRTLRTETKGQAGACPDRTRAIPCTVRAVTAEVSIRRRAHSVPGPGPTLSPSWSLASLRLFPKVALNRFNESLAPVIRLHL